MKLALSLILALPLTLLSQNNSSNWGTDWTQVTGLPSGMYNAPNGIGMVYAAPDGYYYVSSAFGMYRALATNVEADQTCTSCWSAITTGLTAAAGASGNNLFESTRSCDYINSKVVCAFSDVNNGSTYNSKVGVLNGSSWAMSTTNPFATTTGILTSLTHDGSNNIYTAEHNVFKSTDGGVTFSSLFIPGSNGYTDGAVFSNAMKVLAGNVWWGGEYPLIESNLGFTVNTTILHTSNGGCSPCYAHNMRGVVADGSVSTGATSEVLALINDPSSASYVQRLDVSGTGTWSPVLPNSTFATFGGGTWQARSIVQGSAAHEYYVVEQNLSSKGVVLGSIDGGVTWTVMGASTGQVFTGSNPNTLPNWITVSPLDDSKLMSTNSGSPADVVWYHPPPVTNPPRSATGSGITTSGIK